MTTAAAAVTMAEFHASHEYIALTSKQRAWLDLILFEHMDANSATRKVYDADATDVYIAMLRGKVENSPHIIAALNLFHGTSERDAFLASLERTIQRESGAPRVAAQQLLARLKFGDNPKAPTTPSSDDSPVQKFAIGSVVEQEGKKYRVTAQEI